METTVPKISGFPTGDENTGYAISPIKKILNR